MSAVPDKKINAASSAEYTAPRPSNTCDRRVRRTQNALKEALTRLLQEKNISNISVKELTELADINRGTFYLHYRDVFDLLMKLEDDILDQIKETLDHFSSDVLRSDPYSLFRELYSLCKANSELVRILISENGDIRFLNRLKQLVRDKCLNDWSLALKKTRMEYFDAYYAFIVGGCLSLVQYWFANGMKETPEELAEITADYINESAF